MRARRDRAAASQGLPFAILGETTADPTLEVVGTRGACSACSSPAAALEAAWRPPLTRLLEGDPVA